MYLKKIRNYSKNNTFSAIMGIPPEKKSLTI